MSGLLLPPPRRLRPIGASPRLGSVALTAPHGDPDLEPALGRLAAGLEAAGTAVRRSAPGAPSAEHETPLLLRLDTRRADPADPGREGYRLEVGREAITLSAPGPAGLFYGAGTLLQYLRLRAPGGAGLELPGVEIDDRPAFRHRGLLLDVSRNRVPTMASLRALVERLAELKLNQLQLYTEHTFAYRGHEVVWEGASPLTAEEVRELDGWCRERFIELVPNQNSFGHLHRWLRHAPYRALAECPEGTRHPFGDEVEPFSLCPIDPGAVALLADLYGQLLPVFTSRQLNIGCDETFDLGKGRSAEACRERGTGRVYLEFIRRLHALAAGHGRRIQLWGDILASHPELLGELPDDAVVLEWGYEAGHPFAARAAALAGAGLEFYLCPGTSSWNSFAGRLDNALANFAEAAVAGAEHGAAGYLITDWGDHGHLQPPPVSWPPLVAGAALAWNAETDPRALPLAELVDRHAGATPLAGAGAPLVELGGLYRQVGVAPKNASALFKLLLFAHRTLGEAGLTGLDAGGLERAQELAARHATATATGADGPEAGLAAAEIAWVAGMLELACELGRERLAAGPDAALGELPGRTRRRLAGQLAERIEELTPLWLARSRSGGLDDSRGRLERVQALLAGSG